MSPVTVFFRTLVRTSAMFLGAAAMFLHPPLEWRAASHGTVVGAQQGASEAAIDGLIGLLKDTDAGGAPPGRQLARRARQRRAVPGAGGRHEGCRPGGPRQPSSARSVSSATPAATGALARSAEGRLGQRAPAAPRRRSARSAIATRSMR